MSTEKVHVPVTKVVVDIVLIQLVGWPILFLYLWGTAFRRGFFCDDEDLKHPFHESTVPSWTLYITGLGLNVIVIIVTEILNPRNENKEYMLLGFRVPNWVYHAYCALGIFAFGACCSQLTTDVLKYTIGRFRPHFLTVCDPDVCKGNASPMTYHVDFNCTNQNYINNKRIMKEMRLSFPSGHSSFSMYCMLYFAIYLHRRMSWDRTKLLKHTLQFLAVLYSLFTGMTRISDYKHHWSDVLTGLIIGSTTAIITAKFFAWFEEKSDIKGTYAEITHSV
ncbi:putative phosphatidate phosphatase isoform X2 [Aethina tumida]|uniref:putative phosphatidate phosphatase isoform X2 n=1 Tax=Aethina tumida TaxID=116153 RepID=UPI00096B0E35|nr:putative phosphatidate phosphatase isoform X2 [Aethina tumida]